MEASIPIPTMLENKYPFLFQFFAGYFPEADLEQLTDSEIVYNYLQDNPEDIISHTLSEILQVLHDTSYWPEITIEVNRYFQDDQEIKEWLEMIALQLQRTI